jgi:hypothetical protein
LAFGADFLATEETVPKSQAGFAATSPKIRFRFEQGPEPNPGRPEAKGFKECGAVD